jgi:diguanylate cyclase (GGDEF)-like protein
MAAKRQNAGSKGAESLLSAALASMPYGFSIWNDERKLVLCNRRYLDMYRFPPERVQPGMSLMEICELTIGLGNHPGFTAESLHELYQKRLDECSDPNKLLHAQKAVRGRVIKTTHARSPELGWIVTHEDVTEEVEQQWLSELKEKTLADQNTRFNAALSHMSQGLSMYDAEHRLVICNARFREMYGAPEELCRTGVSLDEIFKWRRENGIVPIESADDSTQQVLDETSQSRKRVQAYRMPDGRIISVTQSPMPNGGFVTTHEDVTTEVERLTAIEARERELKLQNMRFDAAVNNMSQGLCMFDKDERLVVCNEPYARIYNLPPELITAGTTLSQILEYRFAHGMTPKQGRQAYAEERKRLVADRLEAADEVDLEDGRSIAVRHHPMKDGGWVATHEDVTEEHRRERELKLQNMRFDAAVNNMSQGLCMFDKEERLVVCNGPYARIYKLPPALTRPGTPLSDILNHRFANGMAPKQGHEAYLESRKQMIAERLEVQEEVELEDGRTISAKNHPIADGGWVATHEDVTEQRRIEARVRHLARHDALTDLPNRVLLREEMEKLEARIQRQENVAVLCLDLDHFKDVNDTLGHGVGDQVLVTVGNRLREASRETDIVARLGGDEFAILVHSLDDPRDAAIIADRIVKSVAMPMDIGGHHVAIGTSVGIALAPTDGHDAEELLRNADLALYRAKSEGRGNYHFFERGMDEALQHRRMLEQGLKVALSRNQFRLMYQPLLDLNDNRVCCFEALLRWDHPERGVIPPAEFIPVAEETGAISAIGEWVLMEACRTAATWPENVRVAVNLSAAQFKSRALVDHVVAAVSSAGISPKRLELEVTESLLLADTEQTLSTLHRLRALGVRISMDDFGTGYSSLSYLRSFPFDKIKIDRSFMSGLGPREDSLAIIKAVIGLGQSLGMSTTAEGIETEEQLDAVRAQGCNEVQGFLFSPPLPASGIAALLGEREASAPVPVRKRG